VKVKYDKEANAAYIQLSSKKPDGAIEMAEGVILHTTSKNEIVAIEILDATKKFPIKTLYKLEVSPAAAWSGEGKRNPRVIGDRSLFYRPNSQELDFIINYDIKYRMSIGGEEDKNERSWFVKSFLNGGCLQVGELGVRLEKLKFDVIHKKVGPLFGHWVISQRVIKSWKVKARQVIRLLTEVLHFLI